MSERIHVGKPDRLEADSRVDRLERRLWMLTENSPLAVIEWDREYRVARWGGMAQSIFGWRSDEVIGRRIDELEIVVEEDWPIVEETMRNLSGARQPHVVSSNRNYTRDRRIITCDWYNSIVTDRDGELESVLSLVLDVTAQQQMAAERDQLLVALQRSNRIKDQFLATLAHELRQPLSALTTAVGVLRLSRETAASERAWRIAARQLEFFTRFVEDLSDLSRIERGELTLAKELVNLRYVIEDALAINEHLLRSRDHRLESSLPDTPILVTGDRSRLQQVFSNLLNNAAKFTPNGGTIAIAATITGENVHISVRDSGRGIPSDQLGVIFEPFAQGAHSPGEGLGIGLSVVRQLVELHGGHVEARSGGDNQGSEFIVRLPVASCDGTIRVETT